MVIIQEIISPIHWYTPPYSFKNTSVVSMNLVLSLFLKSPMDEDLDILHDFSQDSFYTFLEV